MRAIILLLLTSAWCSAGVFKCVPGTEPYIVFPGVGAETSWAHIRVDGASYVTCDTSNGEVEHEIARTGNYFEVCFPGSDFIGEIDIVSSSVQLYGHWEGEIYVEGETHTVHDSGTRAADYENLFKGFTFVAGCFVVGIMLRMVGRITKPASADF